MNAITTIENDVKVVANGFRAVGAFFTGIYVVITNLPQVAKWVCSIWFVIGVMLYMIFELKEGKKMMIYSIGSFTLVKIVFFCFKHV